MDTVQQMPRGQAGASMIEVLVTLVILLVGLLGLAGLQTQALRAEMESYQRIQAIILLQDMVGRINVNRKNAVNYVVSDIGTAADGQPADCTTLAVGSSRDLCEWSNSLKGVSEKTSGNLPVGAMIGARGCITQLSAANKTYLVSVAWQGLGKTSAPPASLTCGKDQYGDDAQRRATGLTLQIGTLG